MRNSKNHDKSGPSAHTAQQIDIYEMASTPTIFFVGQNFGYILAKVLVIILGELDPTVFMSKI